jgi:hypothetical protein
MARKRRPASARAPTGKAPPQHVEARLAQLEELVNDHRRDLEPQVALITERHGNRDAIRGASTRTTHPPGFPGSLSR